MFAPLQRVMEWCRGAGGEDEIKSRRRLLRRKTRGGKKIEIISLFSVIFCNVSFFFHRNHFRLPFFVRRKIRLLFLPLALAQIPRPLFTWRIFFLPSARSLFSLLSPSIFFFSAALPLIPPPCYSLHYLPPLLFPSPLSPSPQSPSSAFFADLPSDPSSCSPHALPYHASTPAP